MTSTRVWVESCVAIPRTEGVRAVGREDIIVELLGKNLNCQSEAKRDSALEVKDARGLRGFVEEVKLRSTALSRQFEFVDSCNGLVVGATDGKTLNRCSTR